MKISLKELKKLILEEIKEFEIGEKERQDYLYYKRPTEAKGAFDLKAQKEAQWSEWSQEVENSSWNSITYAKNKKTGVIAQRMPGKGWDEEPYYREFTKK